MMLTLELAVALPAAALIIASIWHLRNIQRENAVEALLQRDFAHVLAISEKHMNQRAYELVDDVRTQLPAPGDTCSEIMDRILSSHPYAAYLFVYSPTSGLTFRSQPGRVSDPDFAKEGTNFSKMADGWFKMEFDDVVKELTYRNRSGPYMFDANWTMRHGQHMYQSYALFLLSDPSTGQKAIGGMVFDADFLHDRFFPEQLDANTSNGPNESSDSANRPVMMLHARHDWTPIATSEGWDNGEPEVERNLEGAFPDLTLAIKMRGTTFAATANRFMRTNFIILGGLSLLLIGGLVLTYRSVSKEMALAKLKSDFVSNVSHELRTPLSLIRLYAETLEMGRMVSPDKYQEYYQIIRKESERLTALINNILDFSRIEAGRKEYDFRETDISELVRNTLESYRYQIEQQGFAFQENIEPVPPMRVDREAIARSLVNLVNNALKYSQDRKFIGVNLYRNNGSVKLEVVDHGIGIPSQEQDKIFEKFYRVGDPLVHNTKGSGLGLSLVRHIVKAHGGDVSVDSTPGEGSTFTITLPVGVDQQASKATSA
ncbi:MAG TPA: HAMP domain-containing sensor histidine kinase [Terriglobales bacterium]|nr:HAMP domain-containing sensor histidine kinase [Terriglobales bacterium]